MIGIGVINRFGLLLGVLVIQFGVFVRMPLEAEERPNVIVVLVDDLGYYDVGCFGADEVRTPRIDKLAGEGIRFTDYYAAAPICSPSRAGLLTGCYPRRVGNEVWVHRADSPSGIHPDELTLAELFQEQGYATACIGKWHLGFREPFLPRNQGFEYYYGLLHNLDPVETVYFESEGGVPLMRNESVVKRPAEPDELTQLYTSEAIGFIERNRERPFFLYLAHTMLHNPLGVGDGFEGTSDWGKYGDAIQELDHYTGRLLDRLDELGLSENTVVVFLSDNGRGPGRNPSQPIRGHKLTTYEGGIRVPAIIHGPGAGIRSGHVCREIIHAMDWYTTLATLCGISIPEKRILDGRDLSDLLLGRTDAIPVATSGALNSGVILRRPWNPPGEWAPLVGRDDYLNAFFYHGSEGALSAVRSGPWKLFLNPGLTLYNLEDDPGEQTPVNNGKIRRQLRGMAILFQEEMRRDARPAGDTR